MQKKKQLEGEMDGENESLTIGKVGQKFVLLSRICSAEAINFSKERNNLKPNQIFYFQGNFKAE